MNAEGFLNHLIDIYTNLPGRAAAAGETGKQ
jgi:hypothetical protein